VKGGKIGWLLSAFFSQESPRLAALQLAMTRESHVVSNCLELASSNRHALPCTHRQKAIEILQVRGSALTVLMPVREHNSKRHVIHESCELYAARRGDSCEKKAEAQPIFPPFTKQN